MKIFKPTYLYIKQHSITGKYYFGKTTKNPIDYMGSGKHWTNHIKFHGTKYVVTHWYHLFDDKKELAEFALNFSKEMNIVESDQWLNLKAENGLDGGSDPGFKWSEEAKAAIRGRPSPKKGKGKLKPPRINKSVAYKGEGNPFYGKHHNESSKLYGDDNPARRPEVREKMSGPRPNFLPHNHFTGWSEDVKQKISDKLKGHERSPESIAKQKETMKDLVWVHKFETKPKQIKSLELEVMLAEGWLRGRGPKKYWK